jgi:general secretion pathway protein G
MIHSQKKDAFSLMEVMIAVIIMGVLASLAGPAILKKMRQLNVNATIATMANFKSALNDYREEVRHFPTKEEGGLEALVKAPKGLRGWDGSYLEGKTEIPLDRWGNEYVYNRPPKKYPVYKYYEIISEGDEVDTKGKELHDGQ